VGAGLTLGGASTSGGEATGSGGGMFRGAGGVSTGHGSSRASRAALASSGGATSTSSGEIWAGASEFLANVSTSILTFVSVLVMPPFGGGAPGACHRDRQLARAAAASAGGTRGLKEFGRGADKARVGGP
jgi:hypothetical protein